MRSVVNDLLRVIGKSLKVAPSVPSANHSSNLYLT